MANYICNDKGPVEMPDDFDIVKELSNVIYLQDEELSVMGLKIYGSPWQPT